MHWFRTENPLDLVAWLTLSAAWWLGGWLIVGHLFSLPKRERPIAGLACGFLLFIVISNLLGNFLSLAVAFWGASALILALGVLAKLQRDPAWPVMDRLRIWSPLFAFFSLALLFALINRGLAIFDDYHNLPLVSMIAAGDLPPHFYLNTPLRIAYHYGVHLFAASLVRVGGFFPWGAYDLSKAISLAITLPLAWVWFRRATRSDLAAYLSVILVLFGGGTRWFLLFLPVAWLRRLSEVINLLGSARHSGPDLYAAMSSPWEIEGSGPIQFPFAFVNGIFPPGLFAIGGSAAVPYLSLVLLLILARRRWQPLPGLVYGLVLASLALTAEHIFGLILVGILLALAMTAWQRHSWTGLLQWAWVLVPAVGLAFFSGGVLTELFWRWAARMSPNQVARSFGYAGFAFRWPPAILSAHLGSLQLSDPLQAAIAAVEIGPVILLAPWVICRLWNGKRSVGTAPLSLAIAAVLGFVLPIFLRYIETDRDITRFMGSALFIWLLLGYPLAWFIFQRVGIGIRLLLGLAFGATILSGVILFAIMLIAIPHPQFSYFIEIPDARLSRNYWNSLDQDSQILDPVPARAITLFGRGGGVAAQSIFAYLPEWVALWQDPDPVRMAANGYSYLYFDRSWWQDLTPGQRAHFDNTCVQKVGEQMMPDRDFRRLLDIRTCQ